MRCCDCKTEVQEDGQHSLDDCCEIARLRRALEFYSTANDAQWMGDGGERARAALAGKADQ